MQNQKCLLKWDCSQAQLLQWLKPGCAKTAEGVLSQSWVSDTINRENLPLPFISMQKPRKPSCCNQQYRSLSLRHKSNLGGGKGEGGEKGRREGPEELGQCWDKVSGQSATMNWWPGRATSSLVTCVFREAEDVLPRAGRTLCIWMSLVWAHTTD